MDLTTLIVEVRTKAGVDASEGQARDSIITSLINSAARQVANLKDWDWHIASETITSVAGQAVYDRAATARRTDRVVDTSTNGNYKLTQVTAAMGEKFKTHGGVPRFWYIEGGQLVLVPAPTEAGRTYNHVFFRTEITLTAGSDELLMPDWAVDLVIIKAAGMLAARMDNPSQQQALRKEEADQLRALANDASRSRPPAMVEHRRDWTYG